MKLDNWIYLFIIFILIIINFILWKYKEDFKTKSYLEGIDVIYWINLDRSQDRQKKMKKMFNDLVFQGKKIIRISAVDGKAKDIDQILKANFEGMQPEIFTKVEYACTLSHLNVIKQFSKSDEQVALILEDDVTLEYKKYWKQTLNEIIKNAPKDWEIIQLYYTHFPLKNIYTLNTNISGAMSYIINKKGASKITKINNKYNLNNINKHEADHYIFRILKTYIYKYPYFIFNDNNDSNIHTEHITTIHNPVKEQFNNFYKKLYNHK